MLPQAKKFVESVPVTVKEDLTQAEVDALKSVLEEAGATVDVVWHVSILWMTYPLISDFSMWFYGLIEQDDDL